MQQQTYIRAIFTPEVHSKEKGFQPDPDNAVSVTIVAFSDDGSNAVFIDEKGMLRLGQLRQFSGCVFVTL